MVPFCRFGHSAKGAVWSERKSNQLSDAVVLVSMLGEGTAQDQEMQDEVGLVVCLLSRTVGIAALCFVGPSVCRLPSRHILCRRQAVNVPIEWCILLLSCRQ